MLDYKEQIDQLKQSITDDMSEDDVLSVMNQIHDLRFKQAELEWNTMSDEEKQHIFEIGERLSKRMGIDE